MNVVPLFCFNTLRNFTYVITSENKTVCVDPYDAQVVWKYLEKEKIKLDYILNTHSHHDHIKGNDELLALTGAELVQLKDQERLQLTPSADLVAWNTPGHTLDHQVFVGFDDKEMKILLAGDTLFNGGVGNCKNGGVQEVLFETTQMLKERIHSNTIVYPGHDYLLSNLKFSQSLGELNLKQQKLMDRAVKAEDGSFPFLSFKEIKEINIFLKAEKKEEFLKLRNLRDQW